VGVDGIKEIRERGLDGLNSIRAHGPNQLILTKLSQGVEYLLMAEFLGAQGSNGHEPFFQFAIPAILPSHPQPRIF